VDESTIGPDDELSPVSASLSTAPVSVVPRPLVEVDALDVEPPSSWVLPPLGLVAWTGPSPQPIKVQTTQVPNRTRVRIEDR
jgi:hypothetical protein